MTGVVMVFRDATQQRHPERAALQAREYAENIVATVREPLLVLDGDLRVRSANASFYRTFRVTPAETEDRLLYDLGNRQWHIPALRTLLEEMLLQPTSVNDFEVALHFESIGPKVMLLNARRVRRDHADTGLILLAIEDITGRRRLEAERQELETRFTSLVKNIRDHSIFTLDPQGRIKSWNREAERILGYTEPEALGRHFLIIFTPEDIEAGAPRPRTPDRLERRAGGGRALARPQRRGALLGLGHRDADDRRRREAHRLLEDPAGHD